MIYKKVCKQKAYTQEWYIKSNKINCHVALNKY